MQDLYQAPGDCGNIFPEPISQASRFYYICFLSICQDLWICVDATSTAWADNCQGIITSARL